MTTIRLSLAISLVFAIATSAQAEGWRDWVPFAKKDLASTRNPSRPGLTGSRPRVSSARPKVGGPNMLERMGTGTKNFVGKTADVLSSPFQGDSKKSSTTRTGTHTRWDDPQPVKRKDTENQSSFMSWFRPDEPRPSKTMGEFLKQPRVGDR